MGLFTFEIKWNGLRKQKCQLISNNWKQSTKKKDNEDSICKAKATKYWTRNNILKESTFLRKS